MPKPKVIKDGNGVKALVASDKSSGFVDLSLSTQGELLGHVTGITTTAALPPEQARNLATQLNEAADEIHPSGVSTNAA